MSSCVTHFTGCECHEAKHAKELEELRAELSEHSMAKCLERDGALHAALAEVARLRSALESIAKPTYGTELMDTDEERAEILGRHLFGHQAIARAALAGVKP